MATKQELLKKYKSGIIKMYDIEEFNLIKGFDIDTLRRYIDENDEFKPFTKKNKSKSKTPTKKKPVKKVMKANKGGLAKRKKK